MYAQSDAQQQPPLLYPHLLHAVTKVHIVFTYPRLPCLEGSDCVSWFRVFNEISFVTNYALADQNVITVQ